VRGSRPSISHAAWTSSRTGTIFHHFNFNRGSFGDFVERAGQAAALQVAQTVISIPAPSSSKTRSATGAESAFNLAFQIGHPSRTAMMAIHAGPNRR